MDDTMTSVMTRLARDGRLCLRRGRGAELHVESGCIWLTQHNDQTDYVLVAGGSLVLNGRGKTLIHAFADSVLRLTAADGTALPDWSGERADGVLARAA
jgi:hypothetical protein